MNFEQAHARRIHFTNALMNLVIEAAKEGITLSTIHDKTPAVGNLPDDVMDYSHMTSVSEVPEMHHNLFLCTATAVSAKNVFVVTQTSHKPKDDVLTDFTKKVEYYNPHPLAKKE